MFLAKPKQESDQSSQGVNMTGAAMLVEALRREQVEVIFGYPGGAVLPIYDALYQCGIRHILARHEQGSIHAAEGYARVTGKTGVVIATSGPGATNLVTGITDAMIDSLPLVIFTGQVATSVIGTDAFQEASILGITMPVTKHSYQVRSPDELPRVIQEAFHIASTGRKGPVLIDIPKDVAASVGKFDYQRSPTLPGYQPTCIPNRLQIRRVAGALGAAKKPVILAGAGILHARAQEELMQFAERLQIPVANTLLGLGGFPGNHPLCLGMAGMHGTYAANMALYETDFLINIGARFDDRVTGNLEHFARHAKVVHIDIDPAEIGKNVPTQYPVVGDAKQALEMLLSEEIESGETAEWRTKILGLRSDCPYWYHNDSRGLKPQRLIELIHELTEGNAIVTTDVGQHQMWAAQYYTLRQPDKWVTSGGLGTMGFGLPAAIGASLGCPTETVVAILGDAGFQMTLQELALLTEHNIPVKVVIVNNQSLGMVRQWQEFFYSERYSESLMPCLPDFAKLAEAYGIAAFTVKDEAQAKAALSQAFAMKGPVLLDCWVDPRENVLPMVPPGQGIHTMVGVKP